ncbi:MAG: hypothetical protein HY854_01080 [Burkholderiales bacterium]|nr:hypothetical protein [Burkholderiales bacterium]
MAIYNGTNGPDSFNGTSTDDTMTGLAGKDTLQGAAGNDQLDGGADNDLLMGGDGQDTLTGGTGIDLMMGGLGIDTYYVDHSMDRAIDSGSTVGDIVYASSSFILESYIEYLTLQGAGNYYGFGNTEANIITGNVGNNVLDGGAGADTLYGGDGNDMLKGGAGADRLDGGTGNDTYRWKAGTESNGAGTDTIYGFASGTDKLDVSAFDANSTLAGRQSFTYNAAATSFTAAGQLIFVGGTLYGNIDANLATSEFVVVLNGVSSLALADLVRTDTTPAAWLSPASATIEENAGANKLVYKSVVDDGPVTFSLKPVGIDYTRFTINASTGNVTLLDNPDQETKPSYTFTIAATDQAGNTSLMVVTLVVQDLDESSPVITSVSPETAPEISGFVYQALADDSADISAGVTWSISGTDASLLTIGSTTGIVSLASGTLDFEGVKTSYSFTVTASDGVTTPASLAVTVNVANVNEVPIDLSLSPAAFDENTTEVLVGTVTVTDPDASGNNNVLTVDDEVNFEIRNGNELWFVGTAPDHEAVTSYSISITSTDGDLVLSEPFTVTVSNVNEAPTLNATGEDDEHTLYVTETNTTLTSSGTLTVTDPDVGDTVTISVNSVYVYGVTAGLVPTPDVLLDMMSVTTGPIEGDSGEEGNVTWSFDSDGEAFDYLADGETLNVQYTLRADDGGLTDDRTVVVVVTGSNDAPDLTVETSDDQGEDLQEHDSTQTANGTLSVVDPDRSDAVTASVWDVEVDGSTTLSETALFAMLTVTTGSIDADDGETGNVGWSFNSGDENFDFLADGESLVLTYNVKVTDGYSATATTPVTITIEGSNDAPEISVETGDGTTGAVTEGGSLGASDTLTVVDPDLSDSATLTVESVTLGGTTLGASPNGAYLGMMGVPGSVDADAGSTGSATWTFTGAEIDLNYLNNGETVTLTYTLQAEDDSAETDSQTVTITVTGANDGPDISVGGGDSAAGAVTEGGSLGSSGALTVVDPDYSDSVNLSITGVTVGGTTLGAASNATYLAMMGVTGSVAANPGATSNATWTFTGVDTAFDFLDAGETLTLAYTVRGEDESAFDTQAVTISVTGINDGPDITVNGGAGDSASGGVTEGGSLGATDTLTVVDPDLSDAVTMTIESVTLGGTTLGAGSNATYKAMMGVAGGSIAANAGTTANVTWTFTGVEGDFNYLDEGETLTLAYTVRATDNSSAIDEQTVTISVTGANDGPDITVNGGAGDSASGAVTEGGSLGATDTLTVVDPDLSDAVTMTVPSVTLGGTTLGAGSNATYLAMMGVTGGSVAANAGTTANVTWTFTGVEANFDFLDDGESLTLGYTVRATDDSSATDDQTVTITFTGTNDGPDITVNGGAGDSASGAVTEGGALTASDTLTVVDPDLSDSVAMSVQSVTLGGTTLGAGSNPTYLAMLGGTSAANADGGSTANVTWSFTGVEGSFNFLDEGETLTLAYTVRATDDSSAIDEQTVTISVTGANDTAAWSLQTGDADAASITETDAALGATDTLTIRDPDLSDAVTVAVQSVVASGTTTGLGSGNAALLAMMTATAGSINANSADASNVTWTFNSGSEIFNYLTSGQSLVLTYTLRATDDSSVTADKTVTITIDGSNEASANTSGNDTITGTAGADTLTFDAGGNDNVSGLAGNDTLNAGAALTASDTVNGGDDSDTLNLSGDYGTLLTFGPSTVTNVETIVVAAGDSYKLKVDDGTHTTASTITVNGSALLAGNTLTFDASLESSSSSAYSISGGAGADTLTGGAGNDTLNGGAGNDSLKGGAGADSYTLSGGGSDRLVFGTAAANGVDAFTNDFTVGSGTGSDVMDFIALHAATALGATTFATQTTTTTVSAGIIVLTNDALGSDLAAALSARSQWDQNNIGYRLVVWEIGTTSVGVALVNNDDTTNNDDVTATQVAIITGFANQAAVDTFTSGLVAANFLLT